MRLLFEGGFYSRAAFIGEFTIDGKVSMELNDGSIEFASVM